MGLVIGFKIRENFRPPDREVRFNLQPVPLQKVKSEIESFGWRSRLSNCGRGKETKKR